MHVVTFYSFKGGVGRTMALINVAAELSVRRKRVLIVDFDLEAPGIQTYKPFSDGREALGVVDYVTKFIETGEAPDVREYVSTYELNGGFVSLMAAGRQDGAYGRRLNSIDWSALYRDLDGYLMFEDLKQQWKEILGVDYVLIDSRTGHTDVGGICTRQLPDAAVLLFFPNDQNLAGLSEIAGDIRRESKLPREKNIHLHFCPSNVPDIDDEEQILGRHLKRAMVELDYKEPASLIHHYNSLALLDQLIFVMERPMTRLANQYRQLVNSIVSQNLEDESGALAKLEQIRNLIRQDRNVENLESIQATLGQIYKFHKMNGEIAWSLSLAYELLGNLEAQLETLNIAIQTGYKEARARVKRVVLSRGTNSQLLVEDLRAILLDTEASSADLTFAISHLRDLDASWLRLVEKSPAVQKQIKFDPESIANALMIDREGSALAARLMPADLSEDLRILVVLALIGSGEFSSARQYIGTRSSVLESENVILIFNYACAEWGESGVAPKDLFDRVTILGKKIQHVRSPNFWQCISIASFVVGNFTFAKNALEKAELEISIVPPVPIFSGWRFLNVRKKEFSEDLEEIRDQMKTRRVLLPRFLQEPRLLVN